MVSAQNFVPLHDFHNQSEMRKLLFASLVVIVFCQCRHGETFCITGSITGAADSVLYLEHLTLDKGAVAVDSIRLEKDGAFSFQEEAAGNPEFYRLRIGGQGINLGIDSTETVKVTASMKDMSFGYHAEGSGTCDTMRLLCLKLADLERKARRISADRNYTLQEREEMIDSLIERHKTEVKLDFIRDHYSSAYSYYACFQTLGTQLVFDPAHDRSDLVWMQAIANAWNENFPGCQRTENLCNIIQECRRRQAKPREIVLDIDGDKVREMGIIDMTFPDINGQERQLSSLLGKVVLLDFTALSMDGSTERTLLLRELYNKYHERGLEIYQVGLDPNHHLWKQRSEALPWVCVYCEDGLESDMLQLYNVQQLPYFFLIDRNCDLQARQENIINLEEAIERLL